MPIFINVDSDSDSDADTSGGTTSGARAGTSGPSSSGKRTRRPSEKALNAAVTVPALDVILGKDKRKKTAPALPSTLATSTSTAPVLAASAPASTAPTLAASTSTAPVPAPAPASTAPTLAASTSTAPVPATAPAPASTAPTLAASTSTAPVPATAPAPASTAPTLAASTSTAPVLATTASSFSFYFEDGHCYDLQTRQFIHVTSPSYVPVWTLFDNFTNAEINKMVLNNTHKQQLYNASRNITYEIDLQSMTQLNMSTQFLRRIRGVSVNGSSTLVYATSTNSASASSSASKPTSFNPEFPILKWSSSGKSKINDVNIELLNHHCNDLPVWLRSMKMDFATEYHKPGSNIFNSVFSYFMKSYSKELTNGGLKYMWPTCVEVNLNAKLWYTFTGNRLMLNHHRNRGSNSEGSNYELMFHGFTKSCNTWKDLEDKKNQIFKDGFDPTKNIRSAFGRGCYFAKNSGYSVTGFMPSCSLEQADQNYGFGVINKGSGYREVTCILLVRVLKGQTATSHSKDQGDTFVNDSSTETMSIVADPDLLYPEFALYFEGVRGFRYQLPPQDKF
jgi:hypothetical protein